MCQMCVKINFKSSCYSFQMLIVKPIVDKLYINLKAGALSYLNTLLSSVYAITIHNMQHHTVCETEQLHLSHGLDYKEQTIHYVRMMSRQTQ
jgi:hypothetical protein